MMTREAEKLEKAALRLIGEIVEQRDALAESHAELLAALERLLSCCEWKGTATATLNITEFQAALGPGTSALAKARKL